MKKTERTPKQKKKTGKRGVLIAIVVILAVILVALLAVSIFVENLLGRITRADPAETLSQEEIDALLNETDEGFDFDVETIDPAEVTIPDAPAESLGNGENIINILLIGQDNKSLTSRSRSDAMILCTINKEQKTLTMTSFLRDLYLKIPGYYNQRLNVAYAVGGFDTLYETLNYNFGVEVDHGIGVNFTSFPTVIEAVGGVDIELTSREANHLNGQNYTWGLTSGVNHLNGEQALAYARIRKLDSDFSRTNRQRNVITAVIEKAKTLSWTELYSLVQTLIPMVVTDMTDEEIIATAVELAPLLKDIEIVTQRVPADGDYYGTMIDGMSVLVADAEDTRELLKNTIGNTSETEPAE